MDIFISIPFFRPAFRAGGPIQSIANLVSYNVEGVVYYIFCSNVDLNGEILEVPELDNWTNYNAFTKVFYASKNNITSKLRSEINSIKPHKIYINGLFDFKFNLYPLLFIKHQSKILSVRGMLHPGALLQKKTKKKIFLFFIKLLGISKGITFHATNNAELSFIKNIFGHDSKVIVANNLPQKFELQKPLPKLENHLKLVTIALISPMKNHLLVLQSLSQCKANIDFNIYGPVMDKNYWELCKNEINKMPSNITVNYHGEIDPSDVLEALNQNHIYIMPSQSENYGHSIMEALLVGKPIITSHNTPWNGLEVQNVGINVDCNKDEICRAINFFVEMNTDDYKNYCISANRFAIKSSNTKVVLNNYKTLFNNI